MEGGPKTTSRLGGNIVPKRGFTLTEVLIGAAVSLALLGAMFSLFVQGQRIYLRSVARSNLQTAGMVATGRILQELRHSAFSLLTIGAAPGDVPAALAFRIDSGDDLVSLSFTPQPFFIVYYYDAGQRAVIRKTWGQVAGDPVALSPDPILLNLRLTLGQVQQIATTTNGTEQVLAANVDALTLSPARYPVPTGSNTVVTATVGVTIDASQLLGSTPYTESMSASVALRNRL